MNFWKNFPRKSSLYYSSVNSPTHYAKKNPFPCGCSRNGIRSHSRRRDLIWFHYFLSGELTKPGLYKPQYPLSKPVSPLLGASPPLLNQVRNLQITCWNMTQQLIGITTVCSHLCYPSVRGMFMRLCLRSAELTYPLTMMIHGWVDSKVLYMSSLPHYSLLYAMLPGPLLWVLLQSMLDHHQNPSILCCSDGNLVPFKWGIMAWCPKSALWYQLVEPGGICDIFLPPTPPCILLLIISQNLWDW